MRSTGDADSDRKVRFGNEVLYLEIATHDETEQRRLDPTNREHPVLVSRGTAENGVEPCHVDAVKPIGALSADGGVVKGAEVRVGLQGTEGPTDGARVEVTDQDAIDAPPETEKVEDLVDEELALAVGVASVDD